MFRPRHGPASLVSALAGVVALTLLLTSCAPSDSPSASNPPPAPPTGQPSPTTGATPSNPTVAVPGGKPDQPPGSPLESEERVSRSEVLAALSDRVIIPRFQSLAMALAEFSQSLHALCADPTIASLQKAQEGWRQARTQWKLSEVLWFGPVMERRSWQWVEGTTPDRERIEVLLTEREHIDAQFVLDFLPTTQAGLQTMEYLLFQEEPTVTVEVLADPDSPRCDYLAALGEVASMEAGLVLASWQGTGTAEVAYYDVFNGTAPRSLDQDRALAELVRHMVFLIREITHMTWGAALGANGGELEPAAIPGGKADHAVADLRSQLLGIQELYRGGTGANAGPGVGSIIRQLSPEIDQRVIETLEQALAAVDRLAEPVRTNLVADPTGAQEAIDRIMDLQLILNTEVASLLNISIGFNDKDGDG